MPLSVLFSLKVCWSLAPVCQLLLKESVCACLPRRGSLGNKQQALHSCFKSPGFKAYALSYPLQTETTVNFVWLCLPAFFPSRQFLHCCQDNASRLNRCLHFYLYSASHSLKRRLPETNRFSESTEGNNGQ